MDLKRSHSRRKKPGRAIRRNVLMSMSRTVTIVRTLPSMTSIVILVDEGSLRTYVADALESENGVYVGQVVDNGPNVLIAVPTGRHEPCEEK